MNLYKMPLEKGGIFLFKKNECLRGVFIFQIDYECGFQWHWHKISAFHSHLNGTNRKQIDKGLNNFMNSELFWMGNDVLNFFFFEISHVNGHQLYWINTNVRISQKQSWICHKNMRMTDRVTNKFLSTNANVPNNLVIVKNSPLNLLLLNWWTNEVLHFKPIYRHWISLYY